MPKLKIMISFNEHLSDSHTFHIWLHYIDWQTCTLHNSIVELPSLFHHSVLPQADEQTSCSQPWTLNPKQNFYSPPLPDLAWLDLPTKHLDPFSPFYKLDSLTSILYSKNYIPHWDRPTVPYLGICRHSHRVFSFS